ncbi:DUF4145 domain-containing protein [Kamptonema animale CS-326]|jgi:hypothetical protein|uniref:DUF4145 domain-containing protein n=1 Tax=Kamptonema animale TaxID=92934 RepID=UPI00232E1F71|nr:DUF4145 domain-containing protein [Kamptonema animale]MDB9513580.1 DUF4145 domain-containing protein [Kamptonema animale CS-326]
MSQNLNWENSKTDLDSRSYICGHCDNNIVTKEGYVTTFETDCIYICHFCKKPTYFDESGKAFPGILFGKDVAHLPDEVLHLYQESRKCTSVGAYTAATLCCRKILMNVAVNHGAKKGETFVYYINFLEEKGHISSKIKSWLDHIRKQGNNAAHEIESINQDDAETLIVFIEMLLRSLYEFPEIVSKHNSNPPSSSP